MPADQDFKRDDEPSNPSSTPSLQEVAALRLSRRGALRMLGAGALLAGLQGAAAPRRVVKGAAALADAVAHDDSTLTFPELAHGLDEYLHVAEGHRAEVLLRWGDAVLPGAPPFDPQRQSAQAQAQQFGYNNDFVGFMPLPQDATDGDRGLLCVNHEYTDAALMFPGGPERGDLSAEQVAVEMAAHGHSVVEIERGDGGWRVVADAPSNRRITALASAMELTGPAAGHERLRTAADPSGRRVIGTLNNCAGGTTPWGTVLIAEENFHVYFGGDPAGTTEAANHARYGIRGRPAYAWHRYHARFDVERTPHEPNRFGWMVELDPYDPASIPKKRTALGRFKHEGATVAVGADGSVVAYSGDDQYFEYIYRFVATRKFDPSDPAGNRDILDEGVLSVARFHADGTLVWLPLVHGHGPLVAANGFYSQADVLIETRRAADLLGATPMDRPEDVEPNPVTGVVYAMLTNNHKRAPDQVDAANPRPYNVHGHILEMYPPGAPGAQDHTADTYRWDILIHAGDPAEPVDAAAYHPATSANGWFSCPDNCTFDSKGRLWIATDGAEKAGFADGVWATDVTGPGRALTRHFLRTPRGAELCGPCFTPDDRAFFAAVQHPGTGRGATFEEPGTRWPDFLPDVPPRPAVVVVTRNDGGPIG